MNNLYNKNTIINDIEIYDKDANYKRRCKQCLNFQIQRYNKNNIHIKIDVINNIYKMMHC